MGQAARPRAPTANHSGSSLRQPAGSLLWQLADSLPTAFRQPVGNPGSGPEVWNLSTRCREAVEKLLAGRFRQPAGKLIDYWQAAGRSENFHSTVACREASSSSTSSSSSLDTPDQPSPRLCMGWERSLPTSATIGEGAPPPTPFSAVRAAFREATYRLKGPSGPQ